MVLLLNNFLIDSSFRRLAFIHHPDVLPTSGNVWKWINGIWSVTEKVHFWSTLLLSSIFWSVDNGSFHYVGLLCIFLLSIYQYSYSDILLKKSTISSEDIYRMLISS